MSRRSRAVAAEKAQHNMSDWQLRDEKRRKEARRESLGFAGVIALIVVVVLGLGGLFGWSMYQRDHNFAAMQEQVGIVNGESYDMIMADSLQSSMNIKATVFFFSGSITGTSQDKLRMGYTAPDGVSYIINVPVANIKFHPEVNASPEATFVFAGWRESKNFQENIDWGLDTIDVYLTPDQYQQLVNSGSATAPEEPTEER